MTETTKKLIIICMVGAPCSGKSTWIEENSAILQARHNTNVIVISRDNIRDALFGKHYKMNSKDEHTVTKKFFEQLSTCAALNHGVIILDNCHMSSSYIREYFYTFARLINSGKMEFYIEFFQIPLWKAKLRNFNRRLYTGKWIPIDTLVQFYKRYETIDIKSYQIYSEKYGK